MKMFKEMSIRQLRAWIDNAHAVREYDSYFEAATRELNNRTSSPVSKQKRAKNPAPRMAKIKVDDNVVFAASVIKRLNHDPTVVGMRGTVRELMSNGKVAIVDTFGTYPNEEGVSLRTIPVANLAVKGSLAYSSNPAPRHGTASPRRRSQITKAPPSKRLVLRRMENSKKGYFPNPVDDIKPNANYEIYVYKCIKDAQSTKGSALQRQARLSYAQGLILGGFRLKALSRAEMELFIMQLKPDGVIGK
jgi:hypothetical protein